MLPLTCFSTTFAVLGLKLLFGNTPVTFGSVLLLACISGAVTSAWSGGVDSWVETNVVSFVNTTLKEGALWGEDNAGILRPVFSQMLRWGGF